MKIHCIVLIVENNLNRGDIICIVVNVEEKSGVEANFANIVVQNKTLLLKTSSYK